MIVYTRTMETQFASLTVGYRSAVALLSMFAAIAITIALIGQYAVMVFMMKRRTNEFGVRIALGASQRQISTSVLKEGFFLTLSGVVFGFLLSAAAGTLLKSLLYGVSPTDLRTYLGVFILLSTASLMACYLPARRAAHIDPLTALRYE